MGGSINLAFRFQDGEACCFAGWTGSVQELVNLDILTNEQPVRDFISDPSLHGCPVRVSISNYGLILIDYTTKTIIDANSYTSLFGDIWSDCIRKPEAHGPKSFTRHYELLHNALTSGHSIITDNLVYHGQEGLDLINSCASATFPMNCIPFKLTVDISPWRYYCSMGESPNDRKVTMGIIQEIGFPMFRKDGLNINYPA